MDGSGTAEILLLMTEEGKKAFLVSMGLHNYKP